MCFERVITAYAIFGMGTKHEIKQRDLITCWKSDLILGSMTLL